ncbi:MAG: protein kinase [Chloroflexi bacterium]|nr:protein kinase [Chloroflexota bacterium]
MASLLGQTIHGYRIVELIHGPAGATLQEPRGRSGARVYLADSQGGQNPVAVKVFSLSSSASDTLSRLRSGLNAVSRLRHARVPPTLASGVVEGHPYIVVPYYTAGSLSDRLEAGLASSLLPEVLVKELAEVLEYAHAHGVHHGALDPSQLLFDEESGDLRLIGLGQSAVQSLHSSGEREIYRAPEITAGQPATPASDQYSFGVLALELLSGNPAGQALAALRERSVEGHSRANQSDLNERASRVLAKAISVEPSHRFASVAEANRALQIALGTVQPVVDPKPNPAPIRRSRRLRPGLAAVLILLLGLAGTIPAYSAGLIKLPGERLTKATDSADAPHSLEAGVPLPTQDPSLIEPSGNDTGEVLPPEMDPSPEVAASQPAQANQDPTTASPALATDEALAATATPLPSATLPASDTPPPTTDTPPPPTATLLPTNTLPPAPTDTPPPPTAAPTENPKKCKKDPGHPNYCTPTP